ncbi:MAG: GAF domain-containing protein [Phormidesmis sp.]
MNTSPAFSPVSNLNAGECQQILARNLNYQRALRRILHKIRKLADLEKIFTRTNQDIARILNVERVAVYRFSADWSGQFVSAYGYAAPEWETLEAFGCNPVWEDTHLQETQGGRYKTHDTFAVADIYEAGYARCHLEMLEQFEVRAYAISPIFAGDQLWGLLAAYQHSAPRAWDSYEIPFLAQAADYLGMAVQHDMQRQETAKHARELKASVARQKSLKEVIADIHSSLDIKVILKTACRELCELLQVERAAVYQFESDWSGHFVCSYTTDNKWDDNGAFGENQVWQDTYLQETKGGRYRNHDTFVVNDIYQAGHAQCHLDLLEQFQIRAYTIVPILVGDRLWGLFAAYQHSAPHHWQPYETDFLKQISAQIGVAIKQSELLAHSKQQALILSKCISQQQALAEVVNKIRSSVETNFILKTTCREVSRSLEVDRAAVYQFNPDWSGHFISNFSRLSAAQESKTPFGQDNIWQDTYLKETQGGRYRNNETLAVDDIYKADYARCHMDLLEQYNIRAYALVPIFVGKTLWGLLGAYQHNAPYHWQCIEVDFLSQVANQLGIAIQSANSQSSRQVRTEALAQSAAQRKVLLDVVVKMRESLDVETIFNTTVQEIRRSLKSDRVGIFQFIDDTNYSKGKFIAEDVRHPFNSAVNVVLEDYCFGDNYASQYEKGRMQVIPDIRQANFEECHISFLERLQIKGHIVVPLLKGEKLWGLICVHQCDAPRDWTNSEVEFVKQVADQLGIALLQASLHSQTQMQAEQLKTNIKELQDAQLKVIQSEKMASLGQLVAGVAHEINNPVSFIHGNLEHADDYVADLLELIEAYQQAYPEPTPAISHCLERLDTTFIQNDLPKLFQSMQVGTARIREIVNSLRTFSRLDESDAKTVNIHDGIDSTLMILQSRLKPTSSRAAIQVVKDYDVLPQVECFPGQLNQVFMNLLANAIDALEDRNYNQPELVKEKPSQIRITTSVMKPDSVAIHIADNGAGISSDSLNHIFEPFFTTKPVGQGTGLGLSISYQIITEKHSGKLYCHSSAEQGTEFVIEIPIKQAAANNNPTE